MIHILGVTEQDSTWLPPATQNGVQFKIYQLFVSVISHLIFLDLQGLQVSETVEIETVDKGGLP